MAKPTSIAIPTEPIGSIPRPVDLIERVAKGDSEDPNLAPLYEDADNNAAAIYSLVGTAKLNGLDPESYLRDVLSRVADHPSIASRNCCLGIS